MIRRARAVALLAIVLSAWSAACRGAPSAALLEPGVDRCPSDEDRLWMQETLDLWARTADRYLQLASAELPWIVFYDARCAYHVAATREPVAGARRDTSLLAFRGAAAVVHAVPHGGRVVLPDGTHMPIELRASASLYGEREPRPYYTMATISLWKAKIPADRRGPSFSERLLTVSQHELTHTVQIGALRDAVRTVYRGAKPPSGLDDDTIQHVFEDDPTYVEHIRREIDLLFRAAATTDDRAKRTLAVDSLALARQRHARWFVGERAPFARLDGLFLALEGPAEWVRYRLMLDARQLPRNDDLARADASFAGYDAFRAMSPADAIAFIRGPSPHWSQDHGLALFLVVDALLPDWRPRVLGAELEDAFTLLEDATRGSSDPR